jgi:hypothetical protein
MASASADYADQKDGFNRDEGDTGDDFYLPSPSPPSSCKNTSFLIRVIREDPRLKFSVLCESP